jgi:hypothetical protein
MESLLSVNCGRKSPDKKVLKMREIVNFDSILMGRSDSFWAHSKGIFEKCVNFTKISGIQILEKKKTDVYLITCFQALKHFAL